MSLDGSVEEINPKELAQLIEQQEVNNTSITLEALRVIRVISSGTFWT